MPLFRYYSASFEGVFFSSHCLLLENIKLTILLWFSAKPVVKTQDLYWDVRSGNKCIKIKIHEHVQ